MRLRDTPRVSPHVGRPAREWWRLCTLCRHSVKLLLAGGRRTEVVRVRHHQHLALVDLRNKVQLLLLLLELSLENLDVLSSFFCGVELLAPPHIVRIEVPMRWPLRLEAGHVHMLQIQRLCILGR